MKQIIIEIPDNCELKQNGNTYTIVEKEKKLTYEDVSEKLFLNREVVHFNDAGEIETSTCEVGHSYPTNCTSEKQAEKLLAINKLMNVAKWLNDGWQPDWNDWAQSKYYIYCSNSPSILMIDSVTIRQGNFVYFKSKKLAMKAIEILGEETIRLAICTDY